MSTSWLVYGLGFLAQGFFSARMLVQWIMSERAKKIVSPVVYWVCSLAGSILLFIYGWLRDDFSIIFGQLISYYIYIWNLNIKGVWRQLPVVVRALVFALPIVAVAAMLGDAGAFVDSFFHNAQVPMWLLIFGSAGQFIFTVRFIYQWYYSYRRHASMLPVTFWVVAYGCLRRDPVLILGQSVGFVTYSRNIIIGLRARQS